MLAIVHCEPAIPWHVPFAKKMREGLHAIGIESHVTSSRKRFDEGVPILLGTSSWRDIEQKPFLLVDRCSFGNTNEWVSLVWNGHGRRGDHCVRHVDPARWEQIGVEVRPWQDVGKRIVLCGQIEPYSPHWYRMTEWYASHHEATHFRPHPAMPVNPTYLPMTHDWDDVKQVIILNSSVAVDAILLGVPTVCEDEGAMAWPGFKHGEDRLPWLHWLAHTQHHHEEIQDGSALRQMFCRN